MTATQTDWRTCEDCEDCNAYDNVLQPDTFMRKIGDEWVCDLCAERREWRARGAEEKRADWLDDAANYGACETVRVSLVGLAPNGQTIWRSKDLEITGAQARAMFQGIAEAQK